MPDKTTTGGNRPKERRAWPWVGYGLLLLVAVAATVFSLLLCQMAGVWMYDTNLQTFCDTLNPQQREAIIWSARQPLVQVTAALGITNLLWAVATGVLLVRRRRSEKDGNGTK